MDHVPRYFYDGEMYHEVPPAHPNYKVAPFESTIVLNEIGNAMIPLGSNKRDTAQL